MPHDKSHTKPFSVEQIVGIRYWTPTLLSFTTTRPLELNYLPGQYARLALQVDGRLIWRAFSFVSAPEEELLEFVAVVVPDGLFTSRLRELQAGDVLYIEHENYGFLTADRFTDGEDLWMLATGTGIGPFISMLRDAQVWTQFRRILLVHGVRNDADRIYRDDLLQWQSASAKERATLSLIHCISGLRQEERGNKRGNDVGQRHSQSTHTGGDLGGILGEHTLIGRLTDAWDTGHLEAAAGRPVTAEHSRVMLCGNPLMIEAMRARLHARGMKPCRRMAAGQFLTENYW